MAIFEYGRVNTSWRTKLLWTLVVAAFLVLIVAGFYAEENARGLRAWEQCQRDLAARGETIIWTNFLPAPVPDEQNFYKAPMMTEWFTGSWKSDTKTWIRLLRDSVSTSYTNITDENASNLLALTTPYETNFAQIREALKRPSAVLPGDYTSSNNMPNPNRTSFRAVAITLVRRAESHLVQGNPSQALDDLTLMYDLNRVQVKTGKPIEFIAFGTFRVNLRSYVWAIARGIQAHAWTEPQLAVLQKQLAETDLLPIATDSMRAERAALCRKVDTLGLSDLIAFETGERSDFPWWFVPSGWIRENEALCVSFEQEIADCYDVTNHSVTVGKAKALYSRVMDMDRKTSMRTHFALSIMFFYPTTVQETAQFQTWIDQAQIACALERYRLAHGQYPPDLASLAPQYLDKIPHDIINGKPMIYLRQGDHNFLLYSVGWNETDDGGFIYHQDDGRENGGAGDWVWHYLTN